MDDGIRQLFWVCGSLLVVFVTVGIAVYFNLKRQIREDQEGDE